MISCTLYATVSRTCLGQPSCLDKFIHNNMLVHGCIWSLSAISIIVPVHVLLQFYLSFIYIIVVVALVIIIVIKFVCV